MQEERRVPWSDLQEGMFLLRGGTLSSSIHMEEEPMENLKCTLSWSQIPENNTLPRSKFSKAIHSP